MRRRPTDERGKPVDRGSRARRVAVLLAVFVVVTAACDETEEVFGRGEVAPLEQRAQRYCQAQEQADFLVAVYRGLSQSLTSVDDQRWLQEHFFERHVYTAINAASLLDPRVVDLPADQEPRRAELIAMVCERCPERTTGHVQEQVAQEAALRYGSERSPQYDTPMCDTADAPIERGTTRQWEGTLTITDISVEAGPVVCEPPLVFGGARDDSGQYTCSNCLIPPETIEETCHTALIAEQLPGVMLPHVEEELRISLRDDLGEEPHWSVGLPNTPISYQHGEHRFEEPTPATAGVIELESDPTRRGRLRLTGTVSGTGHQTTLSGTFTGERSLAGFVGPWRDDICPPGRCGTGQPDDRVHVSGTWSATEID